MRLGKTNALLTKKIENYVATLASKIARGNYFDGIPADKVGVLGKRKQYWDMLPVSSKQTYLRMMNYIIKDKHEDYHLGDLNFQNTVIGGRVQFINSLSVILSDNFTQNDFFEWPSKLNERIEVSKSDFQYGKLMQHVADYMNIQGNENSRSRRYKYVCPKCSVKYTQGQASCSNCYTKVEPDGYPMPVPDNDRAIGHSFKQYDQIAGGIEEAMMWSDLEQEVAIIENIIPNTNSGYPFFEKQVKLRMKKMWSRFLKFIKYKEVETITIQHVFDVVHHVINNKWHFPYVLFYRTQGGKDGTKHRAVFGAHLLMKFIASVISIGKSIGYYRENNSFHDDKVFTKHIYAFGQLPIVAQANWDEMFTAIKKRMPRFENNVMLPMSQQELYDLFDYKCSPGDYEVNVIGDDFPGFDMGVIVEDLTYLGKHKKLGWLFEYMLDDMRYSEVWTANKILYDIQYKSGFPMTSEFGSFLHRKCNFNAAKANNCIILSNINLSDDDIIYTIGLTPELIDDYLNQFGLKIKVEESYNYKKHKIVGFLKVLVGYVHRSGDIGICGDPTSRYYGLAHQEREMEQEVGSIDFTADVRGIWRITGVVEVDALLSKWGSWGDENSAAVRVQCEIVKDTDLGRKAILAMSHMRKDGSYKPYRSDIEIGFPPNWLANVDVADLIVDPMRMQ